MSKCENVEMWKCENVEMNANYKYIVNRKS